ncbi:unnamed protein product [Adineta ricciae]|uniref:G-patch domain-containing protein n=1 Tax=Adineta ricciae TaxID=249248 RepID=A0A815HW62_ADIRI|nr:unnamed protein product [Adineta ricciae]CAF1357825.1 unnamed protein product [Adineta ricciae]
MDQLAADLNSALNDAHILPTSSSLPNIPIASSSSSVTITKIKRRRKRPVNNEMQQQKLDVSDSTTPENSQSRSQNNKQSIVSDSDDMQMQPKTQSSSLAAASESDSASQTDDVQRRRRPFKKPIIPPTTTCIWKTGQPIKLTRCPSAKVASVTTISTPLRRRRRNCRSDSHCRINDLPASSSTVSSSSSISLSHQNTNYAGKRKRSRTIVHDDYRLRNNSLQDYDMTCIDDQNLTNFSSSSSLNLSDSDKDPCLTSNEADDEQSDWPRDESSVPRMISWWEDNNDNKSDQDDEDTDEKMLTTTDSTLQKIVNGALSMMLTNSKTTVQNRIKTFADREMLTGNRRNLGSKNACTHPHQKRHIRLLKEARRSHHNSYNHKRVKNDHYTYKNNEIIAPIDETNIGHQLLEKIDWTPGNSLGINQNGVTAPAQTDYQNHRQGSGYENASMDISERMENEQTSTSLSSHPSHQ